MAAWEEDERFLNTMGISAGAGRALTTKRAPEGPLRRNVALDYQLWSSGQPPLAFGAQVRVTTPVVASFARV